MWRAVMPCVFFHTAAGQLMPWQDWTLPIPQRVDDLVSRLTLEEIINQTWSIAPAIARFNISAYNWRSNCLHGWAASGGTWLPNETWTAFPEPIGLGATWDRTLIRAVGEVTATEGRALHNLGLMTFGGASTEARGLQCFAPNVNLNRDPRWGRVQETLSEDPYMIGELGVQYTLGLQVGEAPQYIKIGANGKHYAVHDGPESDPISRLVMIANVSMFDLWDSYLPQYRAVVQKAKIASIMCAYSSTNYSNNAPDCASSYLLQTALRDTMGFDGQVISDNGALEFIYSTHKWLPNALQAAAAGMNAGTDNDLGHDGVYAYNLATALQQGLVNISSIKQAAWRNLRFRMQLGDFDPDWLVPYKSIGAESLDTPSHQALNVQSARESLVLVKNAGVLPLSRSPSLKVAVVGPHANNSGVLLGNYQGIPSRITTVLAGIQSITSAFGASVAYAPGCADTKCASTSEFPAALSAAAGADVIIAVVGIDQSFATEGQDWSQNSACNGVSPPLGEVPGCQSNLLQQLAAAYPTTPVVVVVLSGNPMNLPWAEENAAAILHAFYPGSLGGQAVAEALFGLYNPGGRLPFTIYSNFSALPSLADVDMTTPPGRTYRYYQGSFLHPFGFGMSYTSFSYANLVASASTIQPCQGVIVNVTLNNTGRVDGDEVTQLYLQYPTQYAGMFKLPALALRQFSRTLVPAGVPTLLSLPVDADAFTVVDANGLRQILPGTYTLFVGGQQPNMQGPGKSCGQAPLTATIAVAGSGPTPYNNCPGVGH